jgi:hypothetical protein
LTEVGANGEMTLNVLKDVTAEKEEFLGNATTRHLNTVDCTAMEMPKKLLLATQFHVLPHVITDTIEERSMVSVNRTDNFSRLS